MLPPPAEFRFNGQPVRVTEGADGEPWFVAKDVAEILGYSETNRMTARLDADETMSTKLVGMNMNSTIINESGLYNAILGSNKPEAKTFKKWVTGEVLPSIRKKGGPPAAVQRPRTDAAGIVRTRPRINAKGPRMPAAGPLETDPDTE